MTQSRLGAPVSNSDVLSSSDDDFPNAAIDAVPLLRTSQDGDTDTEDIEIYANKTYDQDSSRSWLPQGQVWRSRPVVLLACLTLLVGSVAVLFGFSSRTHSIEPSRYWLGFSNIEHHFAFGDSWTTTRFYPGGEQPSTSNPLGNPAFPGNTSSSGPNYVGYLATQYNHSFIKVYDLAFGGSTIDAGIHHPFLYWLDFFHQLKDSFLRYYTKTDNTITSPLGWTPQNSLFSTFFGINDVMIFNRSNPHFDQLFETYENVIGKLYDASARNFLIINVPPIDKSPAVTARKPADHLPGVGYKAGVDEINVRTRLLAKHLRSKYKDITVFEFDIHELFERVIANPKSIPQTAGYKNTASFCSEYQDGFEPGERPTTQQIQKCGGLDVEEYLWLNSLHVTPPIHEAVAAGIEKLLLDASKG